jgi:cephalosporin hydroxylase
VPNADDREEFRRAMERQSLALGQDGQLFERSKELMLDADKYDYTYLWSWMGLPVIQLPADIMATQEVIWRSKPDVIIETGVARGGSLVFMASLLAAIGGAGRVVGVDIDIRAHNRAAIEAHPMSTRIELIEGGSTCTETFNVVKSKIPKDSRVMVVLDSDHSREHVFHECELYGALVTEHCYLVVADTFVGHIAEDEAPKNRSKKWFEGDDPLSAVNDYLAITDRFEVDSAINGKLLMSSSPGGYLRCVK